MGAEETGTPFIGPRLVGHPAAGCKTRRDLETYPYPPAGLFKGGAHYRGSVQLVSGSGEGAAHMKLVSVITV